MGLILRGLFSWTAAGNTSGARIGRLLLAVRLRALPHTTRSISSAIATPARLRPGVKLTATLLPLCPIQCCRPLRP